MQLLIRLPVVILPQHRNFENDMFPVGGSRSDVPFPGKNRSACLAQGSRGDADGDRFTQKFD